MAFTSIPVYAKTKSKKVLPTECVKAKQLVVECKVMQDMFQEMIDKK